MVEIALRGVEKILARKYVLDHVNMTMRSGELTAIVGEAESGKSTALKVIAGIDKANAGDIFVGERRVNGLKAGKRDVAMVFQNQALLPHKNAYENIAFPLRLAKIDKHTIDSRVRAAAERFGLDDVLDRKPRKLSASQRHLVGLARAVVRRPGAFLFQDAPLGEDAELSSLIRDEMLRLRDQGATIVFATEDGDRARRIADRIIVMGWGQVLQSGSPRRVYERPANRYVAEYFGTPSMNFLPARVTACDTAGITVRVFRGVDVTLPAVSDDGIVGKDLTLGIRPEHVLLRTALDRGTAARVTRKSLNGNRTTFALSLDGEEFKAVVKCETETDFGKAVSVSLPPERCILFDSNDVAFKRPPRESA